MTTSKAFAQIDQLTGLYRSIFQFESEKLSSCLDRDLERFEALNREEAGLLEEVRRLHQELQSPENSSPAAAAGPEDRARLQRRLDDLQLAIRELQMLLHRSRRFVHRSLMHSQGLLAVLFNNQHRGYNEKGSFPSENGSLHGGMRA